MFKKKPKIQMFLLISLKKFNFYIFNTNFNVTNTFNNTKINISKRIY